MEGDTLDSLYIVLAIAAILLFGVAMYIGVLQKKISKRRALFNTNTKEIEILDEEVKIPRSIEKPVIISSTLLEENLEDEEENK